MRIIFVRHGHPSYENDCLTESGHRQAEAAAQRLGEEKIEKIYSSSKGRAVETAEHIAALFDASVEKCDFMREICWGSSDGAPILQNGHPWFTADNMVAKGQSVMDTDWASQEPFCRNSVINCVEKIALDFDYWLAALGYKREGSYYRVCNSNADTVIMVSHAGSSSVVLSHLFNLSFPFVCATLKPDFTSITIVSFDGEDGSLISPNIEILNDTRHIADIKYENDYSQ